MKMMMYFRDKGKLCYSIIILLQMSYSTMAALHILVKYAQNNVQMRWLHTTRSMTSDETLPK